MGQEKAAREYDTHFAGVEQAMELCWQCTRDEVVEVEEASRVFRGIGYGMVREKGFD